MLLSVFLIITTLSNLGLGNGLGVLAMSTSRRLELKNKTKEMFLHAFDHYMDYAFPADELDPIACKGFGRIPGEHKHDWYVNDVLGNFSLTLVDSLDALVIFGEKQRFRKAVRLAIKHVRFNNDVRVQVFEVNIRVLGGLLSAHIFASRKDLGFAIPGYKNELLHLARDLGDRLLPAFNSSTGLPYPRVNLKYGLLQFESPEMCTAGAGSLILEFGMLSRLTGDPRYEAAARTALAELWKRRSSLKLLGNILTVDKSNRWVEPYSGIGAGSDSFYEYLYKAYILFNEEEYYKVFTSSYNAILTHLKTSDGFLYRNVHMDSGKLIGNWIDSLSAFFPGLQVLAGDVGNAIKSHYLYFSIWKRYGGLPEKYDITERKAVISSYPLRPELIESTYMLYQSTRNPFYLEAGAQILQDLETYTRVECGFVSLRNVETHEHDSRMESFFLSETLKYMYLLFDAEHFLNRIDSNFVFTTEGHFLTLPYHKQRKSPPPKKKSSFFSRKFKPLPICSVQQFQTGWNRPEPLSILQLFDSKPQLSSTDIEIAHWYAGYIPTLHSPVPGKEMCGLVPHEDKSQVIVLVPTRESQKQPPPPRVVRLRYGLLVDQIAGSALRIELNKPKNWYEVVSLNDMYKLKKGEIIKVLKDGIPFYDKLEQKDPLQSVDNQATSAKTKKKKPSLKTLVPERYIIGMVQFSGRSEVIEIFPGSLGPILHTGQSMTGTLAVAFSAPSPKFGLDSVSTGCNARQLLFRSIFGKILVLKRGDCSFAQKVQVAQDMGAIGVIILTKSLNGVIMEPAGPPKLKEEDVPGAIGNIDTIDIPSFFAPLDASKAILGFVRHVLTSGHISEMKVTLAILPQLEPVYDLGLKYGNVPISNLVVMKKKEPSLLSSGKALPKVRRVRRSRWRGSRVSDAGAGFQCLIQCPLYKNVCCCLQS